MRLASEIRSNASRAFRASRERFLKERRRRSVPDWATEERCIAAGQSPLADGAVIRYDHSVMPHAVEPMEAADDKSVNIIVLWMARRMAKTEGICGNTIGRTVTDDPGNVYSMWPVEDSADRFSRDVIEPMIQSTPALDSAFVERKSRDSGRTINYKRFAGGSIYIVNAGSPSKMRGMAAKVVLMHEVDAYPDAVGSEGDPVEKALGRAEGFGDAIKFIESTGTLAPEIGAAGEKIYRSRIHAWFERGDQRYWFCPCQRCGKRQVIRFGQIKAPPGELHKARYHCDGCNYAHTEALWRKMVRAGKWFPTAGLTKAQLDDIEAHWRKAKARDAAVRSYRINGFNSLLPTGKGYASKLHQFLAEHDRVKDDPEALRVWVNEVECELWDPAGETEQPPDWKPIWIRREDYADETGKCIVPAKALVLTAAVDVHKDRLEVEWKGWGRGEESWGVMHTVLPGEVEDEAVWMELWRELRREFEHESGALIGLSFAFIDAGKWPDWVFKFLQKRLLPGKVRACRGSSLYPHPVVDLKYRSIAKQLKGHWVGGDAAKDLIYTRLRMEAGDADGRGFMHYPRSYTERYFEQLTAERVTVEYKNGQEHRRYKNPDRARNEALDICVYNLAAFRLRTWNFEAIERDLAAAAKLRAEEKQRGGKPAPEQEKKRERRGRGSFVHGWKR